MYMLWLVIFYYKKVHKIRKLVCFRKVFYYYHNRSSVDMGVIERRLLTLGTAISFIPLILTYTNIEVEEIILFVLLYRLMMWVKMKTKMMNLY